MSKKAKAKAKVYEQETFYGMTPTKILILTVMAAATLAAALV